MEMLAGKGRVPANADQLFLTGLFSLINVMLAQPLEDVLKQVALPETVASALRDEPGAMRDALVLATILESGIGDTDAAAAQCGVDASEVSGTLIDALAWSQQIAAAGKN